MDELYFERMKELLKGDYERYISVFDLSPFRGIRVNTLKSDIDKVRKLPFIKGDVPFCPTGMYIDSEIKIGSHPYHHCGAFYVQEPSAMCAVEMLDIQKGDRVLDLCAAPGSKSTQIGAVLDGNGLLWSNEIIKSRASILVSNIERTGIRNAVISSLSPDILSEKLGQYFDRILVDAPCSGEGMFRKDKKARDEWSYEHVLSCSKRQLNILESAKDMLIPGGILVYSTCTFSKEENEGVIDRFLRENRCFELIEMKRIFPFDGGEGHFAAKLHKKDGEYKKRISFKNKASSDSVDTGFLNDILCENRYENIKAVNGSIYSFPDEKIPDMDFRRMNILRAGVRLGDIKNGRTEPHHNLFTSSYKNDFMRYTDFELGDNDLERFLRGEEIPCDGEKGYTAVLVDSMSLGFGKVSGGRLKNKYPKGLRNN